MASFLFFQQKAMELLLVLLSVIFLSLAQNITVLSRLLIHCQYKLSPCQIELVVIVNTFNWAKIENHTISIDHITEDGSVVNLYPPAIISITPSMGEITYTLNRLGQVNTGPKIVSTNSLCNNTSHAMNNSTCFCCPRPANKQSKEKSDEEELKCVSEGSTWFDIYALGKVYVDQNLSVDIGWKSNRVSTLTKHFSFSGKQREQEISNISVKNIIHPEDSSVSLSHDIRLLVPEKTNEIERLVEPAIEQRSLLIDKSQVDFSGQTCAKIGVSLRKIVKERDRCKAKVSCLENQIFDLKPSSQLSLNFPEASLKGNNTHRKVTRRGVAASSLQIYFQVKDVIFSYNPPPAQISDIRSYSTKSQFFRVHVIIFHPINSTEALTVEISRCNEPNMNLGEPQTQTLHPYQNHEYSFTLYHRSHYDIDEVITCEVTVRNHRTMIIAARRFSLDLAHPGHCIGPCECIWIRKLNSHRRCKLMEIQEATNAGFRGNSRITDGAGVKLTNQHNGLSILSGVTLLISGMLMIGWLKAACGLSAKCTKVNQCGFCLFANHSTKSRNFYWNEGNHAAGDTQTRQPPGFSATLKLFILNSVFIFYLLVLPIHYAVLKCTSHKSYLHHEGSKLVLTSNAGLGPQARKRLKKISIMTESSFTWQTNDQQLQLTCLLNKEELEKEGNSNIYSSIVNRSANNNHGIQTAPKGRSDDECVMGKQTGIPTPVASNKTSPAVLEVTSTTSSHLSLCKDHSMDRVDVGRLPVASSEVDIRKTNPSKQSKSIQQKARSKRRTTRHQKVRSMSGPFLSRSVEYQPLVNNSSFGDVEWSSFDQDENLLYCKITEDMLSNAERETLDMLLDIEAPLYYNSSTPLKGLINSGSMFSLCGRLQQIRPAVYQFDVALHKYQIFECTNHYLVQLEHPNRLETNDFVIKLTSKDAVRRVTTTPVFPCLNKQI